MERWSPSLLLSYCQFLPLGPFYLLYISQCSYIGCIYVYEYYVFLLDLVYHHGIPFPIIEVLVLKSILSVIHLAVPAFFSLPFAWNIFFHPFTFRVCVSLLVKWISSRRRIDGSYVLIYSGTLCLLTGECGLFAFRVNLDRYVYIAILLILFWLFSSFLSLPFFSLLPCGFMAFFSVTLRLCSHFLLHVYCQFLHCGHRKVHITSFVCNGLFWVDSNLNLNIFQTLHPPLLYF